MSDKVAEIIHEIAVDGYQGPKAPAYPGSPALAKLRELGSELWVDTGDREKAKTVWRSDLSALTTNNTLANQVVQSGVMDGAIRETLNRIRKSGLSLSERELLYEIGFVVNCRIALGLVEAFNTKVSVELHPDMARDVDRSLSFARRYYKVNPVYFTVKLPISPEGYLAVRRLIREGIPVNFTLGFSARQNYLAARLSNPDYVNVFLGRLNAVVKDNGIGNGKYVGEKAALGSQKTLDRVRREDPTIKSRQIAASIRDGRQVADLAGVDVLTMPPSALQEFLEMNLPPGQIENRRGEDYALGVDSRWASRFLSLCEVSDAFERASDDLLRNPDSLNGKDIAACFRDHGEPLFHPFSETETAAIQRQGKIPKLSDWKDEVPLDDLMTQSALQSFAVDQEALDNRIRKSLGTL
jgi:transaldolase